MNHSRLWSYDNAASGKRVERVDFSGLTRESSARINRIVKEHGVSPSIEMLDAFRYGKINPLSTQSAAIRKRVAIT